MKLRMRFIPPSERKKGISYLLSYVSDGNGIMQAITVELEVFEEHDAGAGHWARVDLATLPVANT